MLKQTRKIREIKDLGFDADFDTYWKETLDSIQIAVEFFFPKLYPLVDWSHDYKALEQELRNLRIQGKKGEKRVDKLFRLKMLDGTDHFIFIHFEVELAPGSDFPSRLFQYFCKLIAHYGLIKCSVLALYVGDKPSSNLNKYSFEHFGTNVSFGFNTYVVASQKEAELIASDNPIALYILANLYVILSKGDPEKRRQLKIKFFDILAKKKFPEDVIKKVVNFVQFFVRLKEHEEVPFWNKVNKKHLKDSDMTAALRKKIESGIKLHADNYCKAAYGVTPEELAKTSELKGELKAKLEIEKINRQHVISLFNDLGLTVAQISKTLKLEISFVKETLDGIKSK